MAITPPTSESEREKVGVFWKIQLKCCRIGPKPFKIGGEMAKKITTIHCIRFVPFLEGRCQLQVHFSLAISALILNGLVPILQH